MDSNDTKKLLGLQGFNILDLEVKEKEIEVRIEPEFEVGVCPSCGKVSNKRHDYYWIKVLDLPVSGKKVYLHLRRIRLFCLNCQKRFLMDTSLCGKKKSYTWRYGERIYSRINSSTIQDVAKE